MFTKEEKKKLREDFWNFFKSYSNKRKLKAGLPGKWIMDETGIKQLKLKFHFDENTAFAGIEIDTRNLDKRIELYEKLEQLSKILNNTVPHQLIWELEVYITEKKTISRVCAQKKDVCIYNKNCWQDTAKFLYETMFPIENIFIEYRDFLKYQ